MGRSMEAVQKVDLAALADAVVEDFVELGGDVDMVESGRVVASVRPQLMKRALRNLIENSLKYGERAHVELVRDGPELRIEVRDERSEEHTSELQSLMRNSYDVFCLKKK